MGLKCSLTYDIVFVPGKMATLLTGLILGSVSSAASGPPINQTEGAAAGPNKMYLMKY
jgi:hypothetical protein